uniref:NADH-ubiquinone oxidoreductase chain 3 n=1 Tax=Cerion tridentatum costellata TaxID=1108932 RepID=A0A1W6Q5G2_9EUPU|nr:NADH dehydrogenase subunit 3 [Cerion tridentatum costellata]
MMYSMFMVSYAMVLMLIAFSYLIMWKSNHNMTEKKSPFECGFDPLAPSRTPFSTRFILLMIFFLIFDLETVMALPLLHSLMVSNSLSCSTYTQLFFMILLVGLLYEMYNEALDWA